MDAIVKIAQSVALEQFSDLLITTAQYGEKLAKDGKNPGKELYWGGYVDGLRDAASMALIGARSLSNE